VHHHHLSPSGPDPEFQTPSWPKIMESHGHVRVVTLPAGPARHPLHVSTVRSLHAPRPCWRARGCRCPDGQAPRSIRRGTLREPLPSPPPQTPPSALVSSPRAPRHRHPRCYTFHSLPPLIPIPDLHRRSTEIESGARGKPEPTQWRRSPSPPPSRPSPRTASSSTRHSKVPPAPAPSLAARDHG